MLSIEDFRKNLSKDLSDQKIHDIREYAYQFASLALNVFMDQKMHKKTFDVSACNQEILAVSGI